MQRILTAENLSPNAEPLGAADFVALMDRVAPLPPCIAIAVSGGPDSMALAFCIKRWADTQKTPFTLLALIVDHGLRSEAAQEALQTQQRLEAIGIPAEILRWEHAPVVTRLHDTARKARYRLLTEACRRHDIHHLFLAHQREDQAETVLMRFAKGSGIGGLAGMAVKSMSGDVHLWRPLLTTAKDRLIATCAAAKISFITDPSNASDKFARGRLRRVMSLLADEGLTIERLNDLSARAADTKEALEHYTSAFLSIATNRDVAGVIRIDLEHLCSAPKAIAERALGVCLQTVHPEDYAPEHTSLIQLLDVLRSDDPATPCTLHGCLVSKTLSRAIIMREPAGITETQEIDAGANAVWDQRWQVTVDKNTGNGPWLIRPLGHPPHDVLDRLAPELRRLVPQGRARAGVPALWRDGNLTLIPSIFSNDGLAKAVLLVPWPLDKSLASP